MKVYIGNVMVESESGRTFVVAETNTSYGPAPTVVSGDLLFVDMDREIGTSLKPGTYLVHRVLKEENA